MLSDLLGAIAWKQREVGEKREREKEEENLHIKVLGSYVQDKKDESDFMGKNIIKKK